MDQALGVFDTTNSGHNGKDVGQKQVGRMIVPVIVIRPANRNLKEVTNCKCTAEGLKHTEAPKANKASFFEGEIKLSRALAHNSQTYPMGSFVRSPYCLGKTRCSSMVA